ncbi:MAG: cadmium-translocating P-type ATPase [Coriobacteriia bacterium]|nr:cadmium-translocating P-type ATPase [Coriobacteriia bacterium]
MAKSVEQIAGVVRADVNFASGVMVLEYDPATDPRSRAVAIVRSTGHGVEPLGRPPAASPDSEADSRARWNAHEVATTAAGVLIALAWLLGRTGPESAQWASVAAYAAAIVSGGWLVFRRAIASVRSRSMDMNVLMTVAVLGAAGIGEWAEGAAVVFLFSIGGMLESRSLARTRRSIRDLMDLSPQVARVLRADVEAEIPADEVVPGETMVVRPGERVALDGTVVAGSSAVDESPITGESVPVDKSAGDAVFAGSLNTSGRLEVTVTAAAPDSTLARIIFMVEEAQSAKAPSQQLVDRFSRYYTPAVVVLAVLIALVPPAAGALLGQAWGGFGEWFYRALVMLVVSCPCALVISTPVSIVSAITRATRDGVLVKGGVHLESAARIRAVAFDKTGTLTCGTPEVTDVIALDDGDTARVLNVAAELEAHSNHPIARAVVRAAGTGNGRLAVSEYEDVPGGGVRGVVGGVRYAVGNPAFAVSAGAAAAGIAPDVERLENHGRTVLVLVEDGRPTGIIGVADQVRPEARPAVAELLRGTIGHAVMLTGDNERTAAAVAEQAGVAEYRARLLPHGKVDAVNRLQERYGPVAMVGDGINDAPALAASDLGIAMGAAGSDTALETADVALMSDDLNQLARFFDLGRRTVAIIRQNVAVSVLVKFAVLILAMTGTATLWMAVFADTGVSLLVTLNGMRLLARRA